MYARGSFGMPSHSNSSSRGVFVVVIMVTVIARDTGDASERHFVKLTQPVSSKILGFFLSIYLYFYQSEESARNPQISFHINHLFPVITLFSLLIHSNSLLLKVQNGWLLISHAQTLTQFNLIQKIL